MNQTPTTGPPAAPPARQWANCGQSPHRALPALTDATGAEEPPLPETPADYEQDKN